MNLETSQRQSRTMEMHAENARRNNGNARRKCWNTVEINAKQNTEMLQNDSEVVLLRGVHARIQ